jgi:hypothetical protein
MSSSEMKVTKSTDKVSKFVGKYCTVEDFVLKERTGVTSTTFKKQKINLCHPSEMLSFKQMKASGEVLKFVGQYCAVEEYVLGEKVSINTQ